VPDCLDQLDVASYSLTRLAGFSDREPPDAERLERWLEASDPTWRKGSRDRDRLAEACSAAPEDVSLTLSNLIASSSELLTRTDSGWRFAAGGPATTLMRWRLPLGTIHAAAAAAAGRESAGFPPVTAIDNEVAQGLLNTGAVDGHVHLGTCLPFDGLFQLLQARLRFSDLRFKEVLGTDTTFDLGDSEGEGFRAADAIAVGAILASVLEAFLDDESEDFDAFVASLQQPKGFKQTLVQGECWEYLRAADPGQPTRSPRLSRGHRFVAAAEERLDEDPYAAATQRKLRLLRVIVEEKATQSYARCVEDLLRCEATIHAALTQGSRSGLAEFIAISQRLSGVREPLPDQTRMVVGHGLPHLARGMWLRGVELRTAEQFGGHANANDLAASLDAKFAGYEDAVGRIEERKPTATWPICLIRDSSVVADHEKPEEPEPGLVRFDLGALYRLVMQTAELLCRFQPARRLVPGFDVAGEENAVPSWCFTLLFREFMRRLDEFEWEEEEPGRISFRVHAGEDFSSPLQGLRRIDEAVDLVVPSGLTPRIGHGLALAYGSAQLAPERLAAQPLDEAFDDLVWAWWRLEASTEQAKRDLAARLARVIVEKGAALYEIEDATPSDYVMAYRNRFAAEPLDRLWLFAPAVRESDRELSRTVRLPPNPRVEDHLLFTYLTRNRLRAPCKAPLIDPIWLTETINAVRPGVRERLVNRPALIEACPTSNLIIAGINDYESHPIHQWLAEGIRVTINTDDPGLLSVTLVDEYASVWRSHQGKRSAALRKVQEASLGMIEAYSEAEETTKVVAKVRAEFAEAKIGARATIQR
jgi:hypothetical protein